MVKGKEVTPQSITVTARVSRRRVPLRLAVSMTLYVPAVFHCVVAVLPVAVEGVAPGNDQL